MNEKNDYTNDRVPYKATTNLNTAIGNPSVNINDTMNVNIKTMSTPSDYQNLVQNNDVIPNNTLTTTNIQSVNTLNQTYKEQTTEIPSINTNQNVNNYTQNNNIPSQNIQDSNTVKKTYVNMDNKPRKKTITFNLGPEFKIAILIIVILLVFVFLLPIINELIFGY